MIPGEQSAAFQHGIAQVVAGMAGCGDRLDRPIRPGQLLAIGQHPVGGIGVVKGTVGARAIVAEHERRAADDRRAGGGLEHGGGGRVIAVRMRTQDRGDPGLAHSGEDRLDMALAVGVSAFERRWIAVRAAIGWSRIDHCHFGPGTHDIGLGPSIGVVRGIGRQYPPDQRLALFG